MGKVVQILLSPEANGPMESVEAVEAEAGKGLCGDRYHTGAGSFSHREPHDDFEITLVEREQLTAFAAEMGRPFGPEEARRNIVTEGVDLNALVGKRFRLGGAVIAGNRLCEPCKVLAERTFPETLDGLKGRGGLRAQIVTSGLIRVGDTLEEID